MRFVFSFVGILAAVVIVLLVARNQLAATRGAIDRTTSATSPVPAAGANRPPGAIDVSGAAAAGTLPEASKQAQRSVANQVGDALKQGAAATATATEK